MNKEKLEDQSYRIIGKHSAVKICHWAKKSIKNEGYCYKQQFYGIQSHRCLQMTTCMSCPNNCVFCWRDYKSPTEWEWEVDEPELILTESKKAQYKLLTGLGGNEKSNRTKYDESCEPRHVALSLSGEPILYPKINEFIDLCHKNKITTFLVTNGQYPEQIKNLRPVTQLYLSINAANSEMYRKVCLPAHKDYWERYNQSLLELAKRKERTCLRFTLVKELNMGHTDEYSELIKKADPDFIEVKGFVLVGASRQKLRMENMPRQEEIQEFAKELLKNLPDYEYIDEHVPSRVVLLAKKTFKHDVKIDFEKIFR